MHFSDCALRLIQCRIDERSYLDCIQFTAAILQVYIRLLKGYFVLLLKQVVNIQICQGLEPLVGKIDYF